MSNLFDAVGTDCQYSEISIWRRGDSEFGFGPIILGNNVNIFENCRIVVTDKQESPEGGVSIGDGTYINFGSFLSGEGKLFIGRKVLVGPYVVFATCGHKINYDESIYNSPLTIDSIIVDDDCWVGASAVILGGSTLGTGSVVAAGSVVKGHVPEYAIVAGVPARIVGFRKFGSNNLALRVMVMLGFRPKVK